MKDAMLSDSDAATTTPTAEATQAVPEMTVPELAPMAAPEEEYEEETGPTPQELAIQSEDRVARRKVILELQRYYSSTRFGSFLKTTGLVEDISMRTIPEIKELLDVVKFSIQNRSTGAMIQKGVPQLIAAIEPIFEPYFSIKGTANMLNGSEEFHDILEETALASQTFTNTPPHIRLFYTVVKAAFFVNQYDSAKRLEKVPEKPIDATRFKDVLGKKQ